MNAPPEVLMARPPVRRILFVAGAALFAAGAVPLTPPAVGQAAAQFSGGIATNSATGFSLGYTFTVNSPVSVTALGYYDDNDTVTDLDGHPIGGTAMTQSHPVGIFDDQGNLLVQATVTPGDPAYDAYNDAPGTSGDGFQLVRYDSGLRDGQTGLVPLSSFLLTPGQTYSIAGVTGDDYYTYNADFVTTPAEINYGHAAYSVSTTLQAPATVNGGYDPGFFGPDFRFNSTAAAPEPSEWAALGFTGLGVGGLLWRARKRQPKA